MKSHFRSINSYPQNEIENMQQNFDTLKARGSFGRGRHDAEDE